jgi:hypothetical protein
MMKKLFLGVVLLFIVIQFFRPAENNSPVDPALAIGSGPAVLKVSCYDCHSNHTSYPWYNKMQPIAWFLANHVKEGKEELNFDAFNTYPVDKKKRKLSKIVKEVQGGGMPLSSYTLIHKDAVLNTQQKEEIVQWADSLKNSL